MIRLYFGMPQRQVDTATPWVPRISLSRAMIWLSAIFLESFTPALIQPSIAVLSAITVAATTGPKRSPLPLSSSPACSSNQSGWWTSSYPSLGARVTSGSSVIVTNSSVPFPATTSLPLS